MISAHNLPLPDETRACDWRADEALSEAALFRHVRSLATGRAWPDGTRRPIAWRRGPPPTQWRPRLRPATRADLIPSIHQQGATP